LREYERVLIGAIMTEIERRTRLGDKFFGDDRTDGNLIYKGYEISGPVIGFQFLRPDAPRGRFKRLCLAASASVGQSDDLFLVQLQRKWRVRRFGGKAGITRQVADGEYRKTSDFLQMAEQFLKGAGGKVE